jgi:hypothetical protein
MTTEAFGTAVIMRLHTRVAQICRTLALIIGSFAKNESPFRS